MSPWGGGQPTCMAVPHPAGSDTIVTGGTNYVLAVNRNQLTLAVVIRQWFAQTPTGDGRNTRIGNMCGMTRGMAGWKSEFGRRVISIPSHNVPNEIDGFFRMARRGRNP